MIWWLLVEALEGWHVQKKVFVISTLKFGFSTSFIVIKKDN